MASREALEAGVLKLRDDLTQLRRGTKRWAVAVAALLGLIAVLVLWLVHSQSEAKKAVSAGEAMIESRIFLADLAPGEHTFELKYLDRTGKTNGPSSLKFSPQTEQLKNGKNAIDWNGDWLIESG